MRARDEGGRVRGIGGGVRKKNSRLKNHGK